MEGIEFTALELEVRESIRDFAGVVYPGYSFDLTTDNTYHLTVPSGARLDFREGRTFDGDRTGTMEWVRFAPDGTEEARGRTSLLAEMTAAISEFWGVADA